ncbi:MAG: carboxypeptidase regulatory-like domain-containing protein [Thaumarchaeota archaeon]|nr:carboxypeptidase regulatory-like domain-containing protein [Nitrososphaerota archaeon]MDE1840363.1 carboxypeptidase regulatory-like domain-containing protein [Nitrososphaerota archaeon]MDE1878035.1 carboxypeptidase regulatory-like domain-containing protein [Nitrososphaerota archaeon]
MSSIHFSESILANQMIVSVKAETNPITEGGFPTIVGTVDDQAYKPIANANVLIEYGTVIVTTTTDDNGSFKYQSAIPSTHGIYEVVATATKGGYAKTVTNSTFTVMPKQTSPVATRTITGLPIQSGSYTVFLGKVSQWNLETTCFVDFGTKYMRFLKTCDLYNMVPEDFQTDQPVTPMVSVIQNNDTYKLFPENIYTTAANMGNSTLDAFVADTYANYTAPR